MTAGQVVISKRGRDKGLMFVVISTEVSPEGEFSYLADGKLRTLAKPKKKKAKHLQPTNTHVDLNCAGSRGLQDADIRKLLRISKEDSLNGKGVG